MIFAEWNAVAAAPDANHNFINQIRARMWKRNAVFYETRMRLLTGEHFFEKSFGISDFSAGDVTAGALPSSILPKAIFDDHSRDRRRVTTGGEVGIEQRWSPGGLSQLRELYGSLRRFAAVIGKWDVDPDDLVQEAYARVLRRSEDDIDDLGPYLRRTIVNLATDERRKAR